MPNVIEHRAAVFRDGSCTCLARILGEDAEVITQATIDSITYTVSLIDPDDEDADTDVENHADSVLTVSDTISDILQLDDRWTLDEIGYNFRHVLDVSEHLAFGVRAREYRIRYKLQPVSGQVIIVDFRVRVI